MLVVVAVLAGGAILFPSLALLFRLLLRGQFDPTEAEPALGPQARRLVKASTSGVLERSTGARLIAGFGLLTVADGSVEHAFGVVFLLALVVLGFAAVRPTEIAEIEAGDRP